MRLDDAQIARFDEQGYLFCPGLFALDEIALLQDALPDLLKRRGDEVVREPDDPDAVRLLYGSHVFSEAYRRLSLHPRLLGPVRQLLRDEVYIHQSRLNPKQDFGGGVWNWHQDFGTWHNKDGMPEPHCVMVAVFLDASTAANAPLLIVPGSQRFGRVTTATPDQKASGYALYDIDRPTLKKLVDENGIEPLLGPAGSVGFLHCNIVHGSANNITPWRRAILYFNYNAVSNACTGSERAWHHNNRDFTPLRPLADDCLRDLAEPA